jgi:hypothetical protein
VINHEWGETRLWRRQTEHISETFDDNNVTPKCLENTEITCSDYVLTAYDKICYIGKVLENDLSHVAFVTKLVINHEWGETRLWRRQTEHISGHLLQRYSVTVNQVVVTTVKLLKCWLQFKHWNHCLVASLMFII